VTPQVFEGVRVLDIGHIVAGPISASLLADFGAEVLKIEPPKRGDSLRWIYEKDGVGLWYKMEARNKKSLSLDLKKDRGREIFLQLAADADVVVENFRPGVLERLRIGPETLHEVNPKLVICRLSGWGQTGPYASRRSYGRIGEAFSGFAHLTGDPGGPPMHSAMSLGDTVAGVWAAYGIAMALYWRDARGGKGQVIDVGLYEPLYRQIEQQIIVFDQLGINVTRMGNLNPGVPIVGLYQTKDGKYFSFSAQGLRSMIDILRAMGLDGDDRFTSWQGALDNREEMVRLITAWMRARTLAEVVEAFAAHDAPGTPVMSAADLVDDPHIKAREMVITVEDDELGPIRMQGVVPKLSETPGHVRHAGQPLGASNERVYGDLLGLSADDLAELARGEVI
jgi:crotonobetainyl-CoA:carnitine CoA-transferase CaiB-like acyl-CoA transferase